MLLKARHKNMAKKLPREVQEYMKRKFMLLPEYLHSLRCFEYYRQINENQVKSILIFNPGKANESNLFILNLENLRQHPEMLLFEGYIDTKGSVYVADRRTPATIKKASPSKKED